MNTKKHGEILISRTKRFSLGQLRPGKYGRHGQPEIEALGREACWAGGSAIKITDQAQLAQMDHERDSICVWATEMKPASILNWMTERARSLEIHQRFINAGIAAGCGMDRALGCVQDANRICLPEIVEDIERNR